MAGAHKHVIDVSLGAIVEPQFDTVLGVRRRLDKSRGSDRDIAEPANQPPRACRPDRAIGDPLSNAVWQSSKQVGRGNDLVENWRANVGWRIQQRTEWIPLTLEPNCALIEPPNSTLKPA